MPKLDKPVRRIDQPRPFVGGAQPLDSGGAVAAPALPTIPAPVDLVVVSTALYQSAVTPKALANLSWRDPANVPIEGHRIRWATNASFTNAVVIPGTVTTTAGVEGLPASGTTSVTVYFQVSIVGKGGIQSPWSATASAVMPSDTTPPNPPGTPAATFLADGSLRVSWAKPASQNFKSVELRIFNAASKTVEYDLIPEADGTVYEWPAARNRQQTVGSPDGSPDRSVYVELRSRSWGGVFSTTVNASATLALPANVTGATATWDGATGSCRFKWSAVAGAVAYHLTIDGTPRVVADTEYEYTLATNRQEHSGTPDPALSWSIVAIDALDQMSGTPTTGTATLNRPATPSGVSHSWASNANTASADWLLTWTQGTGIVGYRLTIDSVSRDLPLTNRYAYSLTQNGIEHSGMLDPTLDYSLVAVDGLGQTSTTPASGTATNTAPPATTLSVFGAFSQVTLTITASAALDLRDYRVRVYKSGTLVRTLFGTSTFFTYAVEDGSGSYTFDVAGRDLFNQIGTASSQTTAISATDLSQYVADLRSGLLFSDNLSTAVATLAALKDADLSTNVVTYPSGTTWNWTQGDWQEEITHQTTEISLSASASVYLGTSSDGSTWIWHYGGTASGGAWIATTSTSSEATAQGGAITLTAGTWRIDLNAPRRCRFIRIVHRNTGASYGLREFFPSTLIRGTYVQAESITTVNLAAAAITTDKVAAGAITAAKISVSQLSAIAADIGTITAGTITGVLVRTAASGQRVEMSSTGLRTYDSAGSVVIEASTSTNGELRAAAGRVRLTRTTGIQHIHPTTGGTYSPLDFLRSDAVTAIGQIEASVSGAGTNAVNVRVFNPAGTATGGTFAVVAGAVELYAPVVVSGQVSATNLVASGYGVIGANAQTPGNAGQLSIGSSIRNWTPASGSDWPNESTLLINGLDYTTIGFHDASNRVDFIRVGAGLMVLGYNGGFGAANVQMPGLVAMGGDVVSQQRLRIYSTGSSSSDYPLSVVNASGSAALFYVLGTGNGWIAGSLTQASDRRLKRNVRPLPMGLAPLLALRPSSYERIDGGGDQVGLIAQEVQRVPALAHLVSTGADGHLGVNYLGLIAYLVRAVQELAAELSVL
jgi:hypothetical protein